MNKLNQWIGDKYLLGRVQLSGEDWPEEPVIPRDLPEIWQEENEGREQHQHYVISQFSLQKCPKPAWQDFWAPPPTLSKKANAHLNLANFSLNTCPKPSWQALRALEDGTSQWLLRLRSWAVPSANTLRRRIPPPITNSHLFPQLSITLMKGSASLLNHCA